jgi:phosphate transport system protein
MGGLIEKCIADANQALLNKDTELAEAVMRLEEETDEKEKEIEALCLKLLLQQQPVARDLRQISTALKMITDMERIADQSADIAELAIRLAGQELIKSLIHVPQMAEATIKMVNDSINAFVAKDLELANTVIESDDIVDDLFDIIKDDLINLIRENVDNGEPAVDLLMIAKYFERIGDHAVNIAEWVVFSITGKHDEKHG